MAMPTTAQIEAARKFIAEQAALANSGIVDNTSSSLPFATQQQNGKTVGKSGTSLPEAEFWLNVGFMDLSTNIPVMLPRGIPLDTYVRSTERMSDAYLAEVKRKEDALAYILELAEDCPEGEEIEITVPMVIRIRRVAPKRTESTTYVKPSFAR